MESNKHILVIEGGDVRLPNQPRGYHIWVREDGKKDLEDVCLSVRPSEGRFVMDMHKTNYWYGAGPYSNVGTPDPVKRVDLDDSQEALLIRALSKIYDLASQKHRESRLPVKFKLNDKYLARKAFEISPWCAWADGKQKWKDRGNYYSAEELKELNDAMNRDFENGTLRLVEPLEEVVSVD
ncbi:MAG: hypothetical protein WCK29_02230 [archaeon]